MDGVGKLVKLIAEVGKFVIPPLVGAKVELESLMDGVGKLVKLIAEVGKLAKLNPVMGAEVGIDKFQDGEAVGTEDGSKEASQTKSSLEDLIYITEIFVGVPMYNTYTNSLLDTIENDGISVIA
jgi:hypothetical protein